jgi:hypothetical protein
LLHFIFKKEKQMKFKSEPFGGQQQEPVTEPSQPKATSALRDYYEELLREERGPFGKPIYPNPLAGVPKKSESE